MPTILRTHPLVEQILDEHRDWGRRDPRGWAGHRGHVYRVLNLARALAPPHADRDDKLAVAAAFHDLASFATLDYLAPSIQAMDAWLETSGRSAWSAELAVAVARHHRLRRYRGPYAELAEAVRRADLVDVSQAALRMGLPRDFVRTVRRTFASETYFTRSVPRAIGRHLIRHPLDPLPILRARRALKRSGHENRESG